MTQVTANIDEHNNEPNQVDYIIGLLKAGDDISVASYVEHMHIAEIAVMLESLPPDLRQRLWALLPQEIEGETLTYLGEEVRASIIGEMEHADVVAATESMDVVDLADVMDELPGDISEAVLESLDQDRRQRLETTLSFNEDTAGRLMSTDVISVRTDVSLAVVLRYLRRLKPLPSHTDALMVTDDNGAYLGKLSLADAVSEHPSTLVADIMQPAADSVQADANEHDVAQLFERRDLISVAVIDEQGILLGRITVDNVVDIILAEADKALLASAGLDQDEDLFAPVFPSARRRAVWLGINLLTVFMAAWVIGRFEAVLDKIVALAVLMPVVASMGGIAGSQTLTLTIRGLALGQISNANLRWLGNKELFVGILNGFVWAIVVAIVTFVWFQDTGIAAIIAAAMILNLIAAAFSGVLIPVILSRMGIDPALSGAVVLTTVTDVIGFLSFLGLATVFLL
ncbi:MAG: magnesium transporter [Gammaproteobacteria bacterium]|nr:magnesium transporter [Gammaproteobacteria bacterium]